MRKKRKVGEIPLIIDRVEEIPLVSDTAGNGSEFRALPSLAEIAREKEKRIAQRSIQYKVKKIGLAPQKTLHNRARSNLTPFSY